MKKNGLYIVAFLVLAISGCAHRESFPVTDKNQIMVHEETEDKFDLLEDDFFDEDPSTGYSQNNDPLEPMNRFFFRFNDKLYYWILKPASTVYSNVLPYDVRHSIGNFFGNLQTPISFLNNLLQGKVSDAGTVLSRFFINSTLGVFGFGDPALMEFAMQPKPEDFGQTLGVWGIGEGVYLCWPILGPSNVRDSFGFAADAYSHPVVYFYDDFSLTSSLYAVKQVNLLSLNPGVYEDLKKYSLDPYISMRQVYLDYRRQKIQNKTPKQQTIDGF